MSKKVDTAGMWTIKGNPITHDGVAMYSGRAIDADGSLGLDPAKLYPVYRPMEELLKACESFNGKPLINNHEMIGTAEGLTHPDNKNIGGTICNVRKSDTQEGVIVADMTIFSDEIQRLVKDGKCELSLGYWCKYRPEVGTHNGERYEFVQCDLEGNHIALVECGRMGSNVRVYDAKTLVYDSMEISEMKKPILDADELRTEIAGLLKDASDEVLAKCKDLLVPQESKTDEGDDDGEPAEPSAPAAPAEPKEGDEGEPDGEPAKPTEPTEPKKEGDEGDEPKEGDDDGEPAAPAKTGDAAPTMKELLKEVSRRDRLYKSVEPLTGSFDHDEMTARDVAKYAADKLGIACVDGAEVEIVTGYLAGLGAAHNDVFAKQGAMDSGESTEPSEAFKKFLGE